MHDTKQDIIAALQLTDDLVDAFVYKSIGTCYDIVLTL